MSFRPSCLIFKTSLFNYFFQLFVLAFNSYLLGGGELLFCIPFAYLFGREGLRAEIVLCFLLFQYCLTVPLLALCIAMVLFNEEPLEDEMTHHKAGFIFAKF